MKTLFSTLVVFAMLMMNISAQTPDFSPNHNVEVCGPSNVYFVCTAPLNPHNITWHFGDGTTASGITAVHHYNTTGVYDVKLVVEKDGVKDSIVKVAFVTVKPNPEARFVKEVLPTTDPFKRSFKFCGFSNADNIIQYNWKINDTVVAATTHLAYTFPRRDRYSVSLEITNNKGCSHLYSDSIFISGEPLELGLQKIVFNEWFRAGITPDQQYIRIDCLKQMNQPLTVRLYDITGKILVQQAVPAGAIEWLLPVSHIPPGFQIIEISNQTFRAVKRIEKYMQ